MWGADAKLHRVETIRGHPLHGPSEDDSEAETVNRYRNPLELVNKEPSDVEKTGMDVDVE